MHGCGHDTHITADRTARQLVARRRMVGDLGDDRPTGEETGGRQAMLATASIRAFQGPRP